MRPPIRTTATLRAPTQRLITSQLTHRKRLSTAARAAPLSMEHQPVHDHPHARIATLAALPILLLDLRTALPRQSLLATLRTPQGDTKSHTTMLGVILVEQQHRWRTTNDTEPPRDQQRLFNLLPVPSSPLNLNWIAV